MGESEETSGSDGDPTSTNTTPAAPDRVELRNLLPTRLQLDGETGGLLLAPLEVRAISLPDATRALEPYARLGLLRYTPPDRTIAEKLESIFSDSFLGVLVWIVIIALLGYFVVLSPTAEQAIWAAPLWFGAFALAAAIGLIMQLSAGASVSRRLTLSVTLLVVLVVGIALPAASILIAAEGKALIEGDEASLFGAEGGDLGLTRLARALQFVFIVTASLLPALLYFLFDRVRLGTLRQEFNRQIFRLDPEVRTLVDVEAKYGRKLEEVYGSDTERGIRLQRGTHWPILVATILMTLGWILTLLPQTVDSPVVDARSVLDYFNPEPRPIIYAFIGAYFFAITMILRRYTRGDLKSKAYTNIVVRIILTFILAWVIQLLGEDSSLPLLVIAFLVGFFPDVGLSLIVEYAKRSDFAVAAPLKEKLPLTNLQGIDLYDRSRLGDEGVTNIESLAHYDIVDLMIETRLPVPQLIDWVDQAILYLHATGGQSDGDRPDDVQDHLQKLSSLGIRNASDLLACYEAAVLRNQEAAFLSILGYANESETDTPSVSRLGLILDASKGDEWLTNILYWRETRWSSLETMTLARWVDLQEGKAERRAHTLAFSRAISRTEPGDLKLTPAASNAGAAEPPAGGAGVNGDAPSATRSRTDP